MQSSLRKLVWDEDAATAVEHVVLVATVLLCLIVGFGGLGTVCKSKLSSTAVALAPTTTSDTPTSKATSTPDPVAPEPTPLWIMIATGVAFLVAATAPIAFMLLVQKRKKPEEEDEAPQTKIREALPHDIAFAKRQELRRVFSNNLASLLEGHLKVRHVMSRQLTTVRENTPIATVEELMRMKQICHVIVTDSSGGLLGIVSNDDIANTRAKTVQDLATPAPSSLDADADLSPAVTQLIRERATYYPVTSDGKLVGILTVVDFLIALQCALHTLSNVVEQFPAGTTRS